MHHDEAINMEEVYRTYVIPVKRYVMNLCGNSAMADDITADTFYKAIQHIDQFHGGRIFTWLCAIARNTWLDAIKRKEYANISITDELLEQRTEEQLSEHLSLEETCVRKDERLGLYRHLQNLDGEARDVVYLRIFAELSFREIGTVLDKSENWARVTFYRSKEKLKGWMKDETGVTM